MRLIDADALGREVFSHTYSVPILETENRALCEVLHMIHNAPTVIPEEYKPIIDKVVDILPDLTNAITEQLPQIISSRIKCSECSYYKDTWNVTPRPHGKWIFNVKWQDYECNKCHDWVRKRHNELPNFCSNCGADMRGEENEQ